MQTIANNRCFTKIEHGPEGSTANKRISFQEENSHDV